MQFVDCVDISDIGLKEGWLKRSYIGITASTGQLADNHDVVSFSVFDNAQSLLDYEKKPKSERVDSVKGTPNEVRINNLEKKMNEVMEKQSYNDHQIEHDLVEAQNRIENLLSKYKTQIEESSSGASSDVAMIESTVKKEVSASLDNRLALFEKDMNTFVDKKVFDASANVESLAKQDKDKFVPFMPRGKPSKRLPIKTKTTATATAGAYDVLPCSCASWPLYLSFISTVAVLSTMYQQVKKKYLLAF
jgi:hypothetical protein